MSGETHCNESIEQSTEDQHLNRRCWDRQDDQDLRLAGGYGTRLKLTQHQFPVSASVGVTLTISARRWPGPTAMDIASAGGDPGI